jgi:hypothetical protein
MALKKLSIVLSLALALALVLALSLAAQSGETYKARLTAVPADAKTRPNLAGIGSATGVLSGNKLTITGNFEGLTSAATMAKLHAGVAAGVRGPEIQDLTVTKATSGSISGSAELTAQQLQYLRKNGLYIEIYSEKAPEGVIWGWLVR